MATKLKLDPYFFTLEGSVSLMMSSLATDKQIDQKINPRDIQIINLPQYTAIHRE